MAAASQPWKETSAGVWQRPRDACEIHVPIFNDPKLSFGRENFILFVTTKITLQGSLAQGDLKARLRSAWKSLRFEHPALTMTLEGNNVEYRTPSCAEELETWVSRTVKIVDQIESNDLDAFASSLPNPVEPVLYFFPGLNALSIRASHWKFNLTGLFLTMNRLLELIVADPNPNLQWAKESANLRPTLQTALDVPEDPRQPVKDYINEMLGAVQAIGPSAGLSSIGDAQTPPKDTKMGSLILTRAATDALVAWTRKNSFTVTSVIHSATVKATFELAAPECKYWNQSVTLWRDQRRFASVPESARGATYAVDCPLTTSLVPIQRIASFMALADQFTRAYRSDFDDVKHLQGNRYYAGLVMAFLMQGGGSAPPIKPETPPLSSLGVLEEYIRHTYTTPAKQGSLHVEDILIQSENPTRQIPIWLYTWNGQLRLRTSSNEAYAEPRQTLTLLKQIIKELELGTALELDIESE